MPSGYLVSLGNYVLDPNDSIGGPLTSFATDTVIGNGSWTWSGTWNGYTYTNELEPGVYYLATDGNVYFVPDYGPVTTITTSTVTSSPSFTSLDGEILGTGGDDLIDETYVDGQGDAIDDGNGGGVDGMNDTVFAQDGNDTIEAGLGDDLVYGGSGNDQIDGGSGNDQLFGDQDSNGSSEVLDWSAEGSDGTDLSSGFTQDTGDMSVTVAFTSTGNNNPGFDVESTDDIYVATGEEFDPNSSLLLTGNGNGDTSSTTISFSANTGTDVSDMVSNVAFRISDIDWANGNHQDFVTIEAFDANGNPVEVTITISGNDSVSGNTVTAANTSESADDQDGSILVEIAGPVSEIQISYSNGLSGTQAIWVSNVMFDTIIVQGGEDTLLGGTGDDTLDGQFGADSLDGGEGDDQFHVSQGDTAVGGDGDDLFLVEDLGETGDIYVIGGEGDETLGDVLDLDNLADLSTLVLTNTDDSAGGLTGTIELLDGTVVHFDEIEDIIDATGTSILPICFTPGTMILTQHGERPVESLKPGDLVMTRDDGMQPVRWINASVADGRSDFAPILFMPGSLEGLERPLRVSPQHRLLMDDWRNEILFATPEVMVAAKHLVDGVSVLRAPCPRVTYVHLMFDRHQVIYADGVATESFHAADHAVSRMSASARADLFRAFPHLGADISAYGPTVRRCLKSHEARLLLPANSGQPLSGTLAGQSVSG